MSYSFNKFHFLNDKFIESVRSSIIEIVAELNESQLIGQQVTTSLKYHVSDLILQKLRYSIPDWDSMGIEIVVTVEHDKINFDFSPKNNLGQDIVNLLNLTN